jgi:DUF1680 family protein
MKKPITVVFIFGIFLLVNYKIVFGQILIEIPEINEVKITDSFWSPRIEQWRSLTVNDVFNKFEGKHIDTVESAGEKVSSQPKDAFSNFDLVAQGKRDIHQHVGPPWFDGLLYETITGAANFLSSHPDSELEQRIDTYITRIEAAQKAESTGYLETWTQLMESGHHWGENGGFLLFQHDLYNAGMLVEAGVAYYKATGKINLLEVGTRFANYMCDEIGRGKKNVVPAHSGPEDAMMKLFWLYKNHPDIKAKLNVPVRENDYYLLAKYWIENRGNNCGNPSITTWGWQKLESFCRDMEYQSETYKMGCRPSWGIYAQDSIPVSEQKTMEGHAVRATLLATGIADMAIETRSRRYIETADHLWNNMVGKRMYITGGVGAKKQWEDFGPDYYLPVDGYMETCAAVGVGFFSQRMNQITGNAKYMDEFERVLYNNVLNGVSLSGVSYNYQNPLNAFSHSRWDWHECPCCPPMFLKIVSALPQYIYSYNTDNIYVNLFIGSEAQFSVKNLPVVLQQETRYPWDGTVLLTVNPEKECVFSINLRIPGWAQGIENPFGLYHSNMEDVGTKIMINEILVEPKIKDGYAVIKRKWKKGDQVRLVLPMQPRIIHGNDAISYVKGMVAIASGPVVFCLEDYDNENLSGLIIDTNSPLKMCYYPDVLNGVNLIKGKSSDDYLFTAIPYYAVGNRKKGNGYKVWIPTE